MCGDQQEYHENFMPLENLFAVSASRTIQCCDEKRNSPKVEINTELQISNPHCGTVEDGINEIFQQIESHEGHICDICETFEPNNVVTTSAAGNILIVQFKRFDYDQESDKSSITSDGIRYLLTSFITHHGDSLESGHYKTEIMSQGKVVNDHIVSEVDVISVTGFIFFYNNEEFVPKEKLNDGKRVRISSKSSNKPRKIPRRRKIQNKRKQIQPELEVGI